jgi:nitrite reductase (NADH) large subunit
MRVLVLGNGIAGVTTSSELRKLKSDAHDLSIDIFSREPYSYYSRICLPEVVSDKLGPDDIRLYKPAWYEERAIKVHTGEEAVEIDRKAHRVRFVSGRIEAYDKLVIAVGSDGFMPQISGSEKQGVFTLREFSDAASLRGRLEKRNGSLAVIGGGLLGLEAAYRIVRDGTLKVSVLEIFPRLLPRQLDEEGARLLESVFRGYGIEIVLGVETTALYGSGEVAGLEFRDGRRLNADTVLVSMGVRPRISLATSSDIAVNRGIVVNDTLGTSDPDIYAVGDVAEFQGKVWGIIPAAMEQAPVAADSIAGTGEKRYAQTIPRNTLKVAGIELTSVGKVTFDEGSSEGYEITGKTWSDAARYEKYVRKDGRLVGAILLGSKENAAWALGAVGKPLEKEDIERRIGQS